MRFRVLDSWRGIAALLVAVFHLPVSGYVHNAALVRHAYLFVDFFFVLSGFVIAHSLRDGLADPGAFRSFMIRRLGRVYPLYTLVLVAFCGVEIAKALATQLLHVQPITAAFEKGSYADPQALSAHFALLQSFGATAGLSWNWPDWSIAAEVWTYAIFGLTCLLAFSYRRVLLSTLWAAAFVILIEWSHRGIEVTYDLGFVRCVYGFTAGALLYEAFSRCSFALRGVMATVCETAVLAVAFAFLILSGRNPSSFAAPFVFSLVVFVFAFEGGSFSRVLKGGAFQALGTLSYSIYIVHALVVLVFSLGASWFLAHEHHQVWRIETYDGINERILDIAGREIPDMLTIIYLAIVLLVSAMAWRWVETPARNAARGWSEQMPPVRHLA